jgi:hypothetical protein
MIIDMGKASEETQGSNITLINDTGGGKKQ